MKLRRLASAIALLIAASSAANAQIILRTGVDGSNTPLGIGATDPFWTISVLGGGFTSAEVMGPYALWPGPGNICCDMETAGPQAAWVSDPSITPGTQGTSWGINQVAYLRRTFDLTGYDIGTVLLTGIWRTADYRHGVFLNGALIGAYTATGFGIPAWDQDQVITAGSAFFVEGINTIELRGTSGNSAWDGFWLDAEVDGDLLPVTTTPEPATFALFATGIIGLGAVRRRRQS